MIPSEPGKMDQQRKIGRYIIQREIGRGGMAVVYLAFDPHFERQVAITVMPRELLIDPSFLARFKREAKIIASLEHPAIVPVHDYGEAKKQPYLVMRYMPGGSLEDRLRAGPLSLQEVCRLFDRLAPALDEAHAHGIVHRDLKPGNILFDQRGEPHLSDFGIVKLTEATTTLTLGGIIGTPAYMSPEQGRGEKDIDRRADIYSLGAILFHLLTGRLPYEADTPTGQIIRHISDPVPDILSVRSDLPQTIQTVITRSMAKKRDERYATVCEMAQALEDAACGQVEREIKPAQTATPTSESIPESPVLETDKRGLPGEVDVKDLVEGVPAEAGTEVLETDLSYLGESVKTVGKRVTPARLPPSPATALKLDKPIEAVPFSTTSIRKESSPVKRWLSLPGFGRLLAVLGIILVVTAIIVPPIISRIFNRLSVPTATTNLLFTMETRTMIPSTSPTLEFTLPVLAGTPLPQTGQTISSSNADRVVPWARWGKGNIQQVAWSPDGKLLAVASTIGIYLYDAQTLSEIRYIDTSSCIWSITFSPDGQTLVSGSKDSTVRLWRVSDGTLLHTLEGHTELVRSVAFSPDGQTLASGSYDNTIRLWRVSDGMMLRKLEGHSEYVSSVAISPDGQTLVSASGDKTLRLWRVSDGVLLRTLEGHTGWVESVTFSPDGQTLASGSVDKTVRLWSVADGALLRTLEGHAGWVESVTYSPDGQTLVSGSEDKTIRLWRVSDGALLRTLEGHTAWVSSVAFSPDEQKLVSGSWDSTIRLWRLSDGGLLRVLEGVTGNIISVAFSLDGQTLASGSGDTTVRLWRVSDGVLLRTLEGHTDSVTSVAFSPDGQTLASGSWDTTVRLWRVSDGVLLRTLERHTDYVTSVAFSPDGQTLASGSIDNTIRLWHFLDGTLIRTLEGHTNYILSVAFSPDGQTLASGSFDRTIRLWRVSDEALIRTLEGHEHCVNGVAFSPDGQTLASGSSDNTIRLWRVSDGALLHTLEGHTDSVSEVAFSPDGMWLVSGSSDGTIRLWGVK